MQAFKISIHSFQEVRDFVSLATVQPFRVFVGNDRNRVNGKSFMGMFSLDFSEPVQVLVDCKGDEFQQFRQDAAKFAVE